MEPPASNKEESMPTNQPTENAQSTGSVERDVLHIPSQSSMSPEEIAKALAHHQRHHGGEQPQAAAKTGSGKKQGATKSK
jgi:hypothetical protein